SLFNGHEATYADYSHGIRLIQQSMIVDGVDNSVSNVLTNPNLAGLLSDETASEATTNNLILLPRYTISHLPPSIIIQPRSRRFWPGSSVRFALSATGESPLAYRWQFNS